MKNLGNIYGNDYKTFLTDFIQYLGLTTPESWCVDVVRSKDGDGNCLFGHLANFCSHASYDNHGENFDWFELHVGTTFFIYPINDGKNPNYPQETPKERCISYLQAILDGREETTHQSMEIDYHIALDEGFIERMEKAIASPSYQIPHGLSREERRAFILSKIVE